MIILMQSRAALDKAAAFLEKDPSGIMMTLTAMVVVFCSLALLYGLFYGVGRIMAGVARKAADAEHRRQQSELVVAASPKGFAGEAEIAAIALALNAFQSEMHDRQATVLTINRVARAYSPWSSKIYGLRQTPNKR